MDDHAPSDPRAARSASWTCTHLAAREAALDRGHLEPRVQPGQPIGDRYVAVGPLGEGGMGTVWEVEHRELGRRFALKLLHDATALSAVVVARFRREARTAAAIDHPNVVRVVDYHVDAAVGPFLVMELLLGESLAEVMSSALPMALRDSLEWLGPVAHALDALHEHGLVHRDVKPENIVRTDGHAGPLVKLVDFGLAAHADGRDRITRQGMMVGTPHYMAPEVAEGEPASAASDVYSLAVVAFELLTGRLPHDGDSALAVVRAKLTTPPPSLTERSGRIFAVPLELAFQRAFDLDPTKRQHSATELARSLASCIRGQAPLPQRSGY
jgi:serine/threonine-protein kinase